MRPTGSGRALVGSRRALVVLISVVIAVDVVGFLALRALRAAESDFPSLLFRIDALISDPACAAEASAAADAAERIAVKDSLGVESFMSVLSRRRRLSAQHPDPYARSYLSAALEASERFPYSDPLCASVVDAALACPPGDAEAAAALRTSAPRLNAEAFPSLRAAAERRLGASGPSSSLPVPMLLGAADAYARADAGASEALAVDAALASLLGGDALGARTIVRDRFPRPDELSPRNVRFAAELEYDFGDRRQAAALFSRLDGAENALRRADAAFLAGDLAQARIGWTEAAGSSPSAASIALYNLATHAAAADSGVAYARRLVAAAPDFEPGRVLLARLADESSALGVAGGSAGAGLVELERIRTGAPAAGYDRTRALLWMLLNAHPRLEQAAEWTAWYAARNGDFDEALLAAASYAQESGPASWTGFYEGLVYARDGRLDEAGRAFGRAAAAGGDWRLAANEALVLESKRSTADALKRYEIAASLRPLPADAAEIQLRISRLLRSLGRDSDAERALRYAADLDPGNRRVRADLRKYFGSDK